MVGHAQAVWVETTEPLSSGHAREVLSAAPHVRLANLATPGEAAGADDVLVGRIRRDPTVDNGFLLWTVCDNLRKGAALNAVQIAELLLARRLLAA
jgi:aspartate-semialdehyde dehydrogenase